MLRQSVSRRWNVVNRKSRRGRKLRKKSRNRLKPNNRVLNQPSSQVTTGPTNSKSKWKRECAKCLHPCQPKNVGLRLPKESTEKQPRNASLDSKSCVPRPKLHKSD